MFKLPQYQRSVIIGLLLSDGWLAYASKNNKNARLGFEQSYVRNEYVWSVYNVLSHYCSSLPAVKFRVRKGIGSSSIRFTTRSLPCFSELHYLFYLNKIKKNPT